MKNSNDCSSKACIDKPNTHILDSQIEAGYLAKASQMEIYYPSRPLYRTEIGRMTWRLFHRFSVLCSLNDEIEREHFQNFVKGVALFFPCPTCRQDFKLEIEKNPYNKILNQSSTDELVNWVCYQHNQVNEKLNKKLFECNISKIKQEYDF
jgi:hypothetical protein